MRKHFDFLVGICFLLSACSLPGKVVELTPTSYQVKGEDKFSEYTEEKYDEDVPKVEITFSEDEYIGGLYYNQLEDDEKIIYEELYVIFRDRLAGIEIDTLDSELIEKAGTAVMYDHPELFYLTNYSYSIMSVNGEPKYITVDGIYSVDDEQFEAKKTAIEDYVKSATDSLSQTDSDYAKIKAVYDYIIEHTEYDINSLDNQNIASVCIGGSSVCTGYAKTFQYIMHRLGIECELITGYAKPTNERHAWNVVKADGKYYNIDATWGEGSYIQATGAVDEEFLDPVNYNYFLVPDEWILETHLAEKGYSYPVCDSSDLNYFVVNNIFFDTVDEQKLHDLFDYAYINSFSNVKFKASSKEVFNEFYDYLIEDRNIARFVNTNGPIYYVPDTTTNTFIVLLK